MSKNRISERRVAGLLGLAFDAEDGHKRITRGNNSCSPAARNKPTA